jgi:hypothetical protein
VWSHLCIADIQCRYNHHHRASRRRGIAAWVDLRSAQLSNDCGSISLLHHTVLRDPVDELEAESKPITSAVCNDISQTMELTVVEELIEELEVVRGRPDDLDHLHTSGEDIVNGRGRILEEFRVVGAKEHLVRQFEMCESAEIQAVQFRSNFVQLADEDR